MSIRNRFAMLDAIQYEILKPHTDEDFDLKYGQEDLFFLSRLREIHKNSGRMYKIATRAETIAFGAGEGQANDTVLVVSGTLGPLEWKTRDNFLMYCPELKMLYPALHDPNCFGAFPGRKIFLSQIVDYSIALIVFR